MPSESARKECLQWTLRKLSQRDYHSDELRGIFAKKEWEEVGEAVIEELVRLGYLNDREWLRRFIRAEQRRRHGPHLAEAKLRRKRLWDPMAEEVLRESYTPEMIEQLVIELIAKKGEVTTYKEREKICASLYRRGFSAENNHLVPLPPL